MIDKDRRRRRRSALPSSCSRFCRYGLFSISVSVYYRSSCVCSAAAAPACAAVTPCEVSVCSICVPVVLDSFSLAASPFLSVRTCAGCIYWLRGGSMLCPDTIPSVVGALSAAIARGRSDNEIALLAAVFTQLGDSLALILAAKDCPAKRTDSDVTCS